MTTKGLGDYWVVAPDPTKGQNQLICQILGPHATIEQDAQVVRIELVDDGGRLVNVWQTYPEPMTNVDHKYPYNRPIGDYPSPIGPVTTGTPLPVMPGTTSDIQLPYTGSPLSGQEPVITSVNKPNVQFGDITSIGITNVR